jgi:hypothetical protein
VRVRRDSWEPCFDLQVKGRKSISTSSCYRRPKPWKKQSSVNKTSNLMTSQSHNELLNEWTVYNLRRRTTPTFGSIGCRRFHLNSISVVNLLRKRVNVLHECSTLPLCKWCSFSRKLRYVWLDQWKWMKVLPSVDWIAIECCLSTRWSKQPDELPMTCRWIRISDRPIAAGFHLQVEFRVAELQVSNDSIRATNLIRRALNLNNQMNFKLWWADFAIASDINEHFSSRVTW